MVNTKMHGNVHGHAEACKEKENVVFVEKNFVFLWKILKINPYIDF